jgi:hypothetical protein
MKNFCIAITLVTLFSCSQQERKGLNPSKRNYDEKAIETSQDKLSSPSDAIYVFKENIQNCIKQNISLLCDSVFGKGFVSGGVITELQSNILKDINRFDYKYQEVTIDSKDLTNLLSENENGRSSLKYKLEDLSSNSPLKLSSNNVLTHTSTNADLELDINGYNLKFFIEIYMDKELEKDGVYTVSDPTKKGNSPYFKYKGNCQIKITLNATDLQGKTEYYTRNVNSKCDHYTQMQYTNHEVTYK